MTAITPLKHKQYEELKQMYKKSLWTKADKSIHASKEAILSIMIRYFEMHDRLDEKHRFKPGYFLPPKSSRATRKPIYSDLEAKCGVRHGQLTFAIRRGLKLGLLKINIHRSYTWDIEKVKEFKENGRDKVVTKGTEIG